MLRYFILAGLICVALDCAAAHVVAGLVVQTLQPLAAAAAALGGPGAP